ncbi:MAG: tetratricopeptide repeat protein [Caldilineaceae bacterium]|nr:tetratricopeptide repeat protein [Caldilineaceae bacterium]
MFNLSVESGYETLDILIRQAEIAYLQGDYAAAAESYKRALNLSPTSRWIREELADMYGLSKKPQQEKAEWIYLGISPEKMIKNGDDALHMHMYGDAYKWFTRAIRFNPGLQKSLAFRQAITGAISRHKDADELITNLRDYGQSFKIYPVSERVTVAGQELFWLSEIGDIPGIGLVTYGTALGNSSSRMTQRIGYMLWNGEVGMFFNAATEGWYDISVNLQHSSPPPVLMQLRIDETLIDNIDLQKGDNSWEVFSHLIMLQKGIHMLHIEFKNDNVIDGKNRDAAIEWITIQRESD